MVSGEQARVGGFGDGVLGDGGLPVGVLGLVDVCGSVGVGEVDETIGVLEVVRRERNRLEALEGVLLERVRRQGLLAKDAVLMADSSGVWAASTDGEAQLAFRTVVSDVALALGDGEQSVRARMGVAQALVARAPYTLAGALEGSVGWWVASKVADEVARLDPGTARVLDRAVAGFAACQNPRVFARTLRRVRQQVHPTPAPVRHEEAAAARYMDISPGADGMGWLSLFAPAAAIHAIYDRVTCTAKLVRQDGDGRTLGQLRADITCALLLDDGTLDLATENTTTTPTTTSPAAYGVDTPGTPAFPAATPTSPAAHAVATTPATATFSGAAAITPSSAAHSVDTPATPGALAVAPATPASPAPAGFGVAGVPGFDGEDAAFPGGETRFSLAAIARSVRPHIYLTVPVLTLLGRAEEPGMLDGVEPIDPDTARQLAGLATSFTRILTHPHTGKVLAIGSKHYRPPAELRHYLKIRDNTCRFPGCTRPAVDCDNDHTIEWANGGTTTAANLATLCRHHHTLRHQARFTLTQRSTTHSAHGNAHSGDAHYSDTHGGDGHGNSGGGDGVLTWTTPTGRQYTTTPEPIPTTIHTKAPAPAYVPTAQDLNTPETPHLPQDPWGEPPF
jgi:hypothetical protein